jgi:hypothetical protein
LKQICSNGFLNEIYQFQVFLFFKTLFNFEKEWCTFDMEKKGIRTKPSCDCCLEHAKGLLKHHQFASSFEQWNFKRK